MIHLWYLPTPNGKAVTILLKELGLEADVISAQPKGEQLQRANIVRWMPAMVDPEPQSGGEPIVLFEAGAIMLYLTEKTERFSYPDLHGKWRVAQWVIWQMANQIPTLREFAYFRRIGDSEGDQSYAVGRFTDNAKRLYQNLDNQLSDQHYIVGGEYTVADMLCYPWVARWQQQGQSIEEFRHLRRWFTEVGERPRVREGMDFTVAAAPISQQHPLFRAIDRLARLAGDPTIKTY